MHTGRSARRKWDWGSEPPRTQERAAAILAEESDAPARPSRKDKAYCKPNRGDHTPVIVAQDLGGGRTGVCEWDLVWDRRTRMYPGDAWWRCGHAEVCSGCGRVFRTTAGDDCPDRHPITADERARLDAKLRRVLAWRDDREAHKAAITGKQGYRRTKAGRA